jgi:hypothetical protein
MNSGLIIIDRLEKGRFGLWASIERKAQLAVTQPCLRSLLGTVRGL